jgi:hypothetical protein
MQYECIILYQIGPFPDEMSKSQQTSRTRTTKHFTAVICALEQ